jgi:DNA-binding IclR family transcriptional regulator
MDSVRSVGVIDKVAAVLHALGTGPLDLAELQRATRLPRATAHRLAVALEGHRLVQRDGNGRFCLGVELIALGRAAGEQFGLGGVARDELVRLCTELEESVQLYVVEGGARRCVVSLQSPHALRWIVPEGSLLPLELGSAGRALVGRLTEHGWAESVEEREAGVASVSAPVRVSGGAIVAAVSVSGPVERLSRTPGAGFGASVVAAAERIERRLLGS